MLRSRERLPPAVSGTSVADARAPCQIRRSCGVRGRRNNGRRRPASQSPRRASASCCRCRCRRRSTIASPEGDHAARSRQLRTRAARRTQPCRRCLGRAGGREGNRTRRRSAENGRRNPASPAARIELAPIRRPRRRLHDGAAGCGAAHVDERRRGVSAAAAAPAMHDLAGRAGGARRHKLGKAADPSAPPSARNSCATAPPLSIADAARLAGCGTGVVRDLIALGMALERFVSAEPPTPPLPDWQAQGVPLSSDQAAAARRLVADRRRGRLCRHRARRRHRLGQDRNLFRGNRRGPCRRQAGFGVAAGNRAWRAVARSGSASVLASCRRNGIRRSARASAATPGVRSPMAGRGSSSAPARHCSCRFPNSA